MAEVLDLAFTIAAFHVPPTIRTFVENRFSIRDHPPSLELHVTTAAKTSRALAQSVHNEWCFDRFIKPALEKKKRFFWYHASRKVSLPILTHKKNFEHNGCHVVILPFD